MVAIAPILMFPQAAFVWLLLLYPVVIGLQWWAWGEAFPSTPLNPAILLMAIMAGVSIFVTPDLVSSMGKVAGVLLGLLVFSTVVRHSHTHDGWNVSLKWFALAGAGVAALGLLGVIRVPSRFVGLNDLIAMLPARLIRLPGAEMGINGNELGGALLWVVPLLGMAGLAFLAYPRWFAGQKRKGKVQAGSIATWLGWLSITLVFCGGVLILSQSRDAYLALAATLPCLFVVLARGRSRYWVAGLMLAVVVAGIIVVSHTGTLAVLNQLFESLPAQGAPYSINSMFGRFEIWKLAVRAIQENPLAGLGMNIFRRVSSLLDPNLQNPGFDIAHAHNEALQAALDLGLPGLVGFFALYVGAAAMLVKLFQTKGATRLLAIGLFGGLLAHFLFGLTDTIALGAKPGFLFWWALAMLCGLYAQNRESELATS